MVNKQNYPETDIDDALRGTGGARRVSVRFDLLDRHDIKKDELDGITAGGIDYGEFKAIKRSAQFTLTEHTKKNINFLTDQIQPWFILHMPGGTVEWPLGIFLPGTPDREIANGQARYNIGAYDKTLILTEYRFPYRQYFAAGTRYTAAVSRALEMAGVTKVNIEDCELELQSDMEFAAGVSAAEAVSELLTAINYNSLSIDAMGYAYSAPYIPPSQRAPTIRYTADRHSIIAPGFVDSLDIAGRANVFIRVADNIDGDTPLSSVFINDSPDSLLSTVNRGRQITDFETVGSIANQDALDALVYRIATETTSAYRHFTFSTLNMPTHGGAETLYLDIPDVLGNPMKFTETAWLMDLRYDGLMRHEARVIVSL